MPICVMSSWINTRPERKLDVDYWAKVSDAVKAADLDIRSPLEKIEPIMARIDAEVPAKAAA